MRLDSRSWFDGWKCWRNYHVTETENNSGLDLKEDGHYEGRLALVLKGHVFEVKLIDSWFI
jgi:hypothetical protein